MTSSVHSAYKTEEEIGLRMDITFRVRMKIIILKYLCFFSLREAETDADAAQQQLHLYISIDDHIGEERSLFAGSIIPDAGSLKPGRGRVRKLPLNGFNIYIIISPVVWMQQGREWSEARQARKLWESESVSEWMEGRRKRYRMLSINQSETCPLSIQGPFCSSFPARRHSSIRSPIGI